MFGTCDWCVETSEQIDSLEHQVAELKHTLEVVQTFFEKGNHDETAPLTYKKIKDSLK